MACTYGYKAHQEASENERNVFTDTRTKVRKNEEEQKKEEAAEKAEEDEKGATQSDAEMKEEGSAREETGDTN